jgi:hypothetical protein
MKKILFCLLLFAAQFQAQLTLTKAANAPIAGYTYGNNYYDSTISIPKITGLNKNWNFTSLTLNFQSSSIYSYQAASTTPYATSYPSANFASSSGGSSYEYWNSQTNTFEDVGFASGTYSYNFSDPMTWNVWPFTYGNSNVDNFDLDEYNGASYLGSIQGVMTLSASGTGTVTLPSGQKFTNCLQVIRTYSYIGTGTDTYTATVKNYEYWSGSYRNPLITVQYSTVKEPTVTTKGSNVTTNSFADVGINENEFIETGVAIYPNPVKDKMNILLKENALADEIELYDANGNLILSERNTNTINVSALTKGIYSVKIRSKNSHLQKQVIITE